MTALFAFLLSVICVAFILRPLTGEESLNTDSRPEGVTQGLLEQKERFLQVLKDLELDFATGKLTQEDYNQMRNSISLELAGVLKKL